MVTVEKKKTEVKEQREYKPKKQFTEAEIEWFKIWGDKWYNMYKREGGNSPHMTKNLREVRALLKKLEGSM